MSSQAGGDRYLAMVLAECEKPIPRPEGELRLPLVVKFKNHWEAAEKLVVNKGADRSAYEAVRIAAGGVRNDSL
jgi:hypothetical protein